MFVHVGVEETKLRKEEFYSSLRVQTLERLCSCTHQRSRVELRHHVMEEDGEVSRSSLQHVDALKRAALVVDLKTETVLINKHEINLSSKYLKKYLFLLGVEVIVLRSDDLEVEGVGRVTHNAMGTVVLTRTFRRKC